MTCRKCMKELQSNTPYCPWCGTRQQTKGTLSYAPKWRMLRREAWQNVDTAVVTVVWETVGESWRFA